MNRALRNGFLPLALLVASDEKFARIFGLAHKRGGEITFVGERPFLQDLGKYRPTWDLIPVERYLIQSGDYDRALPVYISRGCPFRCGFCHNEVVMKRTWRQHSDEYVLEQVRVLQEKYRVNAIDYADDYLFGRVSLMKRLVEKVGLPWSGQVRVHLLKPEFVQWMNETKCQWVNIAAESGSQRVLDSMHKDQKAEHIEMAVRNLATYAPQIEANLSFIVGLPEENTVKRQVTFDLIEKYVRSTPRRVVQCACTCLISARRCGRMRSRAASSRRTTKMAGARLISIAATRHG